MTGTAGTESWRAIELLPNDFKPHALPEAYISNPPTDDGRFYVPLSETVGTQPLFISPSQN